MQSQCLLAGSGDAIRERAPAPIPTTTARTPSAHSPHSAVRGACLLPPAGLLSAGRTSGHAPGGAHGQGSTGDSTADRAAARPGRSRVHCRAAATAAPLARLAAWRGAARCDARRAARPRRRGNGSPPRAAGGVPAGADRPFGVRGADHADAHQRADCHPHRQRLDHGPHPADRTRAPTARRPRARPARPRWAAGGLGDHSPATLAASDGRSANRPELRGGANFRAECCLRASTPQSAIDNPQSRGGVRCALRPTPNAC